MFKKLRDFLYLTMGISTQDPDPNEMKWLKAQTERQGKPPLQPGDEPHPQEPTPAAPDAPKP